MQFQIAAGAECVKQECGKPLEVCGDGGGMLLRFHRGLWIAREFVEAHGYSLAEVHRTMLFARGNAQEPMAVAEVFVRKTTLLRTKKQSNTAAGELLAKKTGSLIQAADGVLQLTLSNGSSSDNECAIDDRFRDGFEFRSLRKQRRCTDGGTRLAKSQLIRVDNAKMEEAEIAHGASGCADVERIARSHKNDTQAVGISVGEHGDEFTAGRKHESARRRAACAPGDG